jgi:hypothetical protein
MKNKYEIVGDKVKIHLHRQKGTKDEVVWISKSRLGRAMEFKNTWFFAEGYKGVNYCIGFVTVDGKRETIRMHRWLLMEDIELFAELMPNEIIDVEHFDGDGLNNCDDNIYVVTHGENMEAIMKNKKYNMDYFRRKQALRNFQLMTKTLQATGFSDTEIMNAVQEAITTGHSTESVR